MFKFKMLRKVLVAVFFYSLIIELNLNLCIALSIDLSATRQLDSTSSTCCPLAAESAEANPTSGGPGDSLDEASGMASSGRAQEPASSKQSGQRQAVRELHTEAEDLYDSRASMTIPLVQVLESNGRHNYFGQIRVGDKRQLFYMMFDLTSNQFWLPSSECKSRHCLTRQRYNRTESSSYKADEFGRRIDGALDRDLSYSGQIGRDRVELAGSTIEDQEFGELDELEGDILDFMPVDGFMGFGLKEFGPSQANDSTRHLVSPVERLWSLGRLREPIVSLELWADVEQYFYSNNNGELRLGQLAPDYTPAELSFVPVRHGPLWEFHLEGVALRSTHGAHDLERGCESACPAILDTRHAFIGGHFNDVDRINKAMGAFAVGNGIYRLSSCDLGVLPQLIFQIGGHEFVLEPDEYVDVHRIRGEPKACYSALVVVEASDYPFWILGEFFLKRHYVVLDYGQRRVGLARSKRMSQKTAEQRFGRVRGFL